MTLSRLLAAALTLSIATPALAEDTIPGHAIDRGTDGAILGGTLGVALGVSLIPVHPSGALWEAELFGAADASVHTSFSPRAAQISDGLVAASVVAPLVYLTGTTIEDADGDRMLIYGEVVAINLALFQGVKRMVQRPRPYLYSSSPDASRYARTQGDDAYLSFYSGHSSTAFSAATAGAYLAGATTTSSGARAIAWGAGFATAAAAANLRVRAGKHFYSDIVIGGLIGVAIGYAVPALHADGEAYVPSLTDLSAAAAGLLGGSLVSALLPLERRPEDNASARPLSALRRLHLGPIAIPHGAGLGLGGVL